MSEEKKRLPRVWSLTGLETVGLFEHLNTLVDAGKHDKQLLLYLIGLVIYQIPEDQQEAAMKFAGEFMRRSSEGYNQQMLGASKKSDS